MHSQIVTIESLSPTGHGIADNGWYILGGFPGDIINARKYKSAENIHYAEIIEIIEPSKDRVYTPAKQPFFHPNAPWQHLDIQAEDTLKKQLIHTIFEKHNIKIRPTITAQNRTLLTEGYRNKVAYAFTIDPSNTISFALFTRGISQTGKIPQTENILVHPVINRIGKQFLTFFNQKNVPLEILKYLVLRYSYTTNTVVAHILVTETNRKKLPWKKSDLKKFQNNNPNIAGILVSHSEVGIRSSITTKDFYEIGNIEITEEVLNKKYTYHPSQFFQIYPDAFVQILNECTEIIQTIPHHNEYELLDLFAGVGIIGLHLSDYVASVHGVEQSPLAKKYALINAEQNNIQNLSFTESSVDEALTCIQSHQILVVDPARSGLTKKLISKIIKIKPEYIIYISCNPETQARDYTSLQEVYSIEWSRGYNLFPKTPHIEHVLFLKRKN